MGSNSTHFMQTKRLAELEDIHFGKFLVVFSKGVTCFNIFLKEIEMFYIVFIRHARGVALRMAISPPLSD